MEGEGHMEEAVRHSRAARDQAARAFGEARAAAGQVGDALDLQGRMDRHPYLTVLAAAGVGYVLGGGLFTRFTGRLVRLGLRVAVVPLVRDRLEALGEAALTGTGPAPGFEGSEDGSGGL